MPCDLRRSACERLRDLSGEIFTPQAVKALVLELTPTSHGKGGQVSQRLINNVADLKSHLSHNKNSDSQDSIVILQQNYSWDRLQITSAAFYDLTDHLNVFPEFFNVVNAYGIKTRDDERAFYSWRASTQVQHNSVVRYEHCYNVPFMDKHGRGLRDPWSLRQTGVYQQFDTNKRSSHWIMLNLRDEARSSLEHTFKTKSRCCNLSLHIELLLILEVNWTEYIEYLSVELSKHDDNACYSSIDRIEDGGFTVSYEDLQKLHMLQAKIERAKFTVSSCAEIGTGCHDTFIAPSKDTHRHDMACPQCICLLESYRRSMEGQLESTIRLEHRLQNVLNLISRILICRNEILLSTSNKASSDSLGALLDITTQSRGHQESLTQILSVVQADSVLLKALSIVATVCLPASLIAAVFSSNLVQTIPDSSKPDPAHLLLSPQFWIYVALAVPTMLLTLACILYLDHRAYKKMSRIAAGAGFELQPRQSYKGKLSKSSSETTKVNSMV